VNEAATLLKALVQLSADGATSIGFWVFFGMLLLVLLGKWSLRWRLLTKVGDAADRSDAETIKALTGFSAVFLPRRRRRRGRGKKED